jgi:hypothetical protein
VPDVLASDNHGLSAFSLVVVGSLHLRLIHFVVFSLHSDFDAIKLPSEQLELGMSLIEKMSSADFEPERYADDYRERALASIEEKSGRPGNQSRPVGTTAHRPRSLTSARH